MGKPKKGSAPAKTSDKPAVAAAREDDLFETATSLPPVPEDDRLTVTGAKLGPDGKLDVPAYEDLQSYFAGEPSPAQHPIPDKPGVCIGEEVPKGLRVWDDLRAGSKGGKEGAGWIAIRARKNEPKREKWFNIRTCGSWRLAFLLARLQLELFERGIGVKPRGAGGAAPGAEAEGSAALAKSSADDAAPAAASARAPEATPQKKRQAPAPEKPSSRKKAKAATPPDAVPAAPPKPSVLGAGALAGSVRVQQILAARRAEAERLQQEAAEQG